jgi:hypothetical protein
VRPEKAPSNIDVRLAIGNEQLPITTGDVRPRRAMTSLDP